ncbi:MAG: NAD(P)H-binding protein [Marinirhabdus sp.]|nr:NAD(P)H-binding protein [Marinirhabdus sp.]
MYKTLTILVKGASGATGNTLVAQLLNQQHTAKVIVRTPEKLPEAWKTNAQIP